MSKHYDASTKYLVEDLLPDWLPLSNRVAGGLIETIDADLSTVTAAADKVLRIHGPPSWLLHMELQAHYDALLSRRLHLYNTLLGYRHEVPVRTMVVLLRPQADSPGLTGSYEQRFPGEKAYSWFEYQIVRLWQMPVANLLTAGIGLLPLAPLTDVSETALPAVIRQMEERIRKEASVTDAGVLWTATSILMGLRYPRDIVSDLLKGVHGMKESVTYQAILDEGRQEGLQKGLQEGRQEGRLEGRQEGRLEGRAEEARTLLIRFGTRQLGAPSAQIIACLQAITDVNRLEELVDHLPQAKTWEGLLAVS